MNYLKAIGYGIALWAIIFVVASVLIALGLKTGTLMEIITLIAVVIATFILARNYKIESRIQGLLIGVIWLVVNAAIEYLVTVRGFLQGDLSFYSWSVLAGYALILLIPIFVLKSE
jgi:uncharacterized membrane protein YpjA